MQNVQGHRGVLTTVLWRVVPASCLAIFAIWLLVGIGGVWILIQRNAESLRDTAQQQAWAVADNVEHFFDSVRSVSDNALTVNAFIDPMSVEHFLEPFFRSFRIGRYESLTITMTDFAGMIIATNMEESDPEKLPPKDLWLTPAIDGHEVLTVEDDTLIVAVPVRIGALPEGAILVTLSRDDTKALFSSKQYGGEITLRDQQGLTLFDTRDGRQSPGADKVEEVKVDLDGFSGLSLTSVIATNEDTPLLGVLHSFLLIAFLADLIAVIFGIYMTANLVAGPLNKLVSRIQSMQKLSDPNERLAVEGPRELRNLALAFNRAAEQQTELMLSLEQSLDAEKEINQTQRQFVSLVSHEFRTPLAIIDGQAQRVIRRIDREPPEGIVKSMEKCRAGVSRLIGLIESVLSSSRLEAGTIAFNPDTCRLVDLVTEVSKNQEEIAGGHQIMVDIETLPETIIADEKLMRQVFTNLLSNAVKYSPGASHVWVNGRREGSEIFIAIRDEGVGIPEDEIKKLFSRFFRASTASGIAGTGIGLNLVKQLVEMHQGDVTVTSVAREGTTFTVRLPVEMTVEPVAEAA